MSFDDGSLGRREERADPRPEGRTGPLAPLAALYERVRTHCRTWPRRYVEMRTGLFDDQ